MERLTKKSLGCFKYDLANFEHKVGEFTEYDTFFAYNMAVKKLGEIEDFIEEEGFEDLQDLKRYIEQSIKVSELITKKKQENQELKDHTYDLNNKLLNIQLFLKDLRDSFHKEDETYEEIDKKLKELGGDR